MGPRMFLLSLTCGRNMVLVLAWKGLYWSRRGLVVFGCFRSSAVAAAELAAAAAAAVVGGSWNCWPCRRLVVGLLVKVVLWCCVLWLSTWLFGMVGVVDASVVVSPHCAGAARCLGCCGCCGLGGGCVKMLGVMTVHWMLQLLGVRVMINWSPTITSRLLVHPPGGSEVRGPSFATEGRGHSWPPYPPGEGGCGG